MGMARNVRTKRSVGRIERRRLLAFIKGRTITSKESRPTSSIEVERIAIDLCVFLGFLLGGLEFLFKDAVAVLHRAQFLGENLLAHLLLFVQPFHHLVERRDRLHLFFMCKKSAGVSVNSQGRVAAGANNSELRTVHVLQVSAPINQAEPV